ncbi:MAG: single-stranded DNA-binding protein [Bacteroidetes bacterium]|nr:single-stranded DNA-binding protein [Bacteroidota bacterium]MBU2584837.1 single-stranded DNA-binding protein [Bacteroidota bacterium]
MASSLNKVMLIGYTGKDAEVRYSNTGLAVLTISLATNEPYKDAEGNWKENTTWHDIVCYGNLAERMKENLKKGKRVYVEGRISKRNYIDKNQNKRWVTEVVGSNIILLERIASDADARTDETTEEVKTTESADVDVTPDEDLPF